MNDEERRVITARFNAIEMILLMLFVDRCKAAPNPRQAAGTAAEALEDWLAKRPDDPATRRETAEHLDELMRHVLAMLPPPADR